MAKLLVRRKLIKGMHLKAAAYWYSVFRFPTFRRKAFGPKTTARRPCFKACNKHTESPMIFLGIKIPNCINRGYLYSYFVSSLIKIPKNSIFRQNRKQCRVMENIGLSITSWLKYPPLQATFTQKKERLPVSGQGNVLLAQTTFVYP